MMDVDQPVPSTKDKEEPALDTDAANTLVAGKSPLMDGHENDDLPAVLISDSDEEDPSNTPIEVNNKITEKPEPAKDEGRVDVLSGDISGITPMEATVVSETDGRDKEEKEEPENEKAETVPALEKEPEPEASAVSVANDDDVTVLDNIDLTGVSSAEESGISETGCEKPIQREIKVSSTPVKSSSDMTAQEMLQSLLEEQEEAFAAHRASEANRNDLMEFNDNSTVDQRKDSGQNVEEASVVALDDTSICGAGNEPKDEQPVTNKSGTSLQTDSEQAVKSAISSDTEKGSSIDLGDATESSKNETTTTPAAKVPEEEDDSNVVTIIDDECLLEEMPNVTVSQRQQEADKERNASNNSPSISEEVEASNKSSDDIERSQIQDGNDNGSCAKITHSDADGTDDNDTNEPPRKKARSMNVTSELPAEPACNSSSGPESEVQTGQKDQPAEEITETDGLKDRLAEVSAQQAKLHTDLLEAQVQSAALESLQNQKSDGNTATTTGSPDENTSSENSTTAKEPSITVGTEACVPAKEPTVALDVLVIDDDDDDDTNSEAAGNDSKVKTMDSTPNTENEEDKPKPAAVLKKLEIQSTIPLFPVPPELKSDVPLQMEFVRRFCKPLTQMTRSDLEQLVLQKISEALVHKSDNAFLRAIIKKQAVKLHGFERTLADMQSHYEALKLVSDRAVEDMKKRANVFVAPVKITRAVGLQVSRCGSSTEMFKSANTVSGSSGRRKVESVTVSMATGTLNGASETNSMREQPAEPVRKVIQQTVAGVQRNIVLTPVRHQITPNAPHLLTTRTSPNVSSVTNGVVTSFKPYVAKLKNSLTTVAGVTSPSNTIRVQLNTSNGPNAPVVSHTTPTLVNAIAASPNSGVNAGGVDSSPVRKKQLHKITPMRPPLSAFQQAQQEKQARQQQELLLQQIHEQNQQVQRKAQTNARPDVPVVENAIIRPAPENGGRPRPGPYQQGRVLNANLPTPVSSTLQLVPLSTLRTSSTAVSSTTSSATQKRPNPQPSSTVVSSSVDDSLIDLTEEDETQGVVGTIVPSNVAKRPRSSMNGPQTIASAQPPTASIPVSQIATNQLLRIQSKISKPDASGAASTMTTNTASVYQHQNGVAMRPLVNAKRINAPPLQPVRQLLYANNMQRPPVPATDQAMLKKRVLVKPAIQALIVPLPPPGPQPENDPSWKLPPPQPTICVNNVQTGIVISWLMPTLNNTHADIENYQIYAYQEVSSTGAAEEWRHVGDVKALLLPMAVTLTQFQEGQRYYFAVRAIDKHKRVGMFSDPRTWSDTNVSNA